MVLKDKINNKNIGILTVVVFGCKFLLDFLRFTHMKDLISFNQIMCVPFILCGLFLIMLKKEYIGIKNANE